jgi:hypothetical protein
MNLHGLDKKTRRKKSDERPKVNVHRSFIDERELKDILYSIAISKLKEEKTATAA